MCQFTGVYMLVVILLCYWFRYDTMQALMCWFPRFLSTLLREWLAFVFPRHKGSTNDGVLSIVWKSPVGISIRRASVRLICGATLEGERSSTQRLHCYVQCSMRCVCSQLISYMQHSPPWEADSLSSGERILYLYSVHKNLTFDPIRNYMNSVHTYTPFT